MIKSSLYLLRDFWVFPVINKPFVWEMGNPTFFYNINLTRLAFKKLRTIAERIIATREPFVIF